MEQDGEKYEFAEKEDKIQDDIWRKEVQSAVVGAVFLGMRCSFETRHWAASGCHPSRLAFGPCRSFFLGNFSVSLHLTWFPNIICIYSKYKIGRYVTTR